MGVKYNFVSSLHHRIATITGVILIIVTACTDHDSSSTVSCSGVTVSYETDVSPIIQSSCATNSNCHGSGSNHGPGELLTYSDVYSARNSISTSVTSGDMPKEGSLTSDEKNAILCWITSGASNN
ncbi:hypothetical protein [Ohtaekwangia koreensis]|uniref:Cytochrome c domain-containing protein n=1 Tax=Ohtaekwangia koreensis TaxID=688867 RepID=A0A1T5K401_9BACT|nr:hypothetical protein [Ohtaekwangia koreensis]SKC58209.1 hypothetical protein SAMN05660236_1776 [Ohtaekwangia koreensis]